MRKISGLLMLVLVLCLAVPAFSFSGGKLSNAMNSAALAGQNITKIMHLPEPWANPMYLTMINNLSDAWAVIDREIASIKTPQDIANARAIVNNYKSLTGTYRDLGHQVEISLEKQIKFLEIHGN